MKGVKFEETKRRKLKAKIEKKKTKRNCFFSKWTLLQSTVTTEASRLDSRAGL